jgi:hypothetical protein
LIRGVFDEQTRRKPLVFAATGYITPKDMLAGRQQGIHAERDRKLDETRKQRQIRRQQAA